jgi:hypothetical protein
VIVKEGVNRSNHPIRNPGHVTIYFNIILYLHLGLPFCFLSSFPNTMHAFLVFPTPSTRAAHSIIHDFITCSWTSDKGWPPSWGLQTVHCKIPTCYVMLTDAYPFLNKDNLIRLSSCVIFRNFKHRVYLLPSSLSKPLRQDS